MPASEDHEFLLATTEENLKHAEEMKKHPDMEHDEPNGVRLEPNKIGRDRLEIHQGRHVRIFLPDPDHRDYGMIGTSIVK